MLIIKHMKKDTIRRFLGKSIKTQLVVFSFALTGLSVCIVAVVGIAAVLTAGNKAQQTTGTAMEQRVKQFLVETTEQVATKNSIIFRNIQTETTNEALLTQNMLENPSSFPGNGWKYDQHVSREAAGQYKNPDTEPSSVYIQNYITITPQIKKAFELTNYLDYSVPQLLSNDSNAAAFYYIGTQGETRYYPNIGLADIVGPDYNPTTDVFYTPATPENNPDKSVVWSKVYDDPAGNGLLITAAHPLTLQNGGFAGIVGMDVTLNAIAKNIADYKPIESSYSFLIDNAGRAVALPEQGYQDMLGRSPKKGEFGPDLTKAKGDFASVLSQMRAGKEGFSAPNVGSADLYIAYTPVPGTNFSLAIVARQKAVLSVVGTLQSQVHTVTTHVLLYEILPLILIIMALLLVFGVTYISYLTAPLIELTARTHKVTQGDLHQRMSVTSDNEIGKLAGAFNVMTAQLAESYQALEHKVQDRTRALNRKVHELGIAKAKDDAILDSIGDGMIVTDADGKILLLNIIAAELRGMDEHKAVGTNIDEYPLYDEKGGLITAKDRPMRMALKTGKKISQDARAKGKDGTKNAINVTATPVIQDGNTIGAVQTIRDVTKEREVDRMKTEFISLASHQLRTPLSAIKWYTEMLMAGDAGKLKSEQQEFATNVYDSTQRMIELVNSLLNISRIESGRIMIEPKPTDLKELVQGIVTDLKAKTEERNQTLIISVHKDLPKINLDSRLIGQVYLNLLTNAIKYTPKGGEISVFISRKDDQIISQVTDNGYGIPKAEQGKLFQKFFRATNIIKVETDGTGLGMYLVKAIVESSGGKIWFKSETNKGTTFWFALPASGMKAKKGEVTLDV